MVCGFSEQENFYGNREGSDFDVHSSSSGGLESSSVSTSVDGDEESCLSWFDGPKRIKLLGTTKESIRSLINISKEPSPLGLILPKTRSFLDLLQTQLSKVGKKTSSRAETKGTIDCKKSKSKTNDFAAQSMAEKLKASNFSASFLKIGSWERVSKHEGDLVAKCYYAKRKLVWEVLNGGLKRKIEIQWSDICAIKAFFPDNRPGILEVELSHAPLFFEEISPQPRKHTVWQPSSDFTANQASEFRRHHLQFPEGTLEKHYQKLLQCDNRLLMLSQRPFPSQNSPYFHAKLHRHQDLPFNFRGHQPEFVPRMQYPPSGYQRPALAPSHHQVQAFQPVTTPPIAANYPNSSMSVMNFPLINGNGSNHGIHHFKSLHQAEGLRNDVNIYSRNGGQIRDLPTFISANHADAFLPRCRPSECEQLGLPSQNRVLNDIANHLLDDTNAPVFPSEQRVQEKVNSMYSILNGSEVNPTGNTDTKYTEYCNKFSANNSMELRSTNPLSENSELLWKHSVNWVSAPPEYNENFLMNPPEQFFDDLGGQMRHT